MGNGIAPGHKAGETIHITQFIHQGWELFGQMQESAPPMSPSDWLSLQLCKKCNRHSFVLFFLI